MTTLHYKILLRKEAVSAIRAGLTRVVGKRTPPRFFIGNTVQSICLIVRKRVRRRREGVAAMVSNCI